jgi:Na+-driven multidrug efflux pump
MRDRPYVRNQRDTDEGHLRLLAIFHFVNAGLAFFGALVMVAEFFFMEKFFNNPNVWQGQKNAPNAPPIGPVFEMVKWVFIVCGLFALLACFLNVLSGYCLSARKNRAFSLVVAGLNCLNMPLGTILGAFTFVVLLRDSVRDIYEQKTWGPELDDE